MSFFHFMEKKGYKADLEKASKVTLSATTALKKLVKAQHGEKDPAKAERLTKVEAAKVRLINAKVTESTIACLTYDLFCKFLRDKPKIQWDRIVTDMHTKILGRISRVLSTTASVGNHSNPQQTALSSTSSRFSPLMQQRGLGTT
jgi:hypothetical protein